MEVVSSVDVSMINMIGFIVLCIDQAVGVVVSLGKYYQFTSCPIAKAGNQTCKLFGSISCMLCWLVLPDG